MQKAANKIKKTIQEKEKQLTNTGGLEQRLYLVKDIAQYYTFTNVNKAEEYLIQLRSLAEAKNKPEFLAYYHSYSSLVENHLYNYNQAIAHLQKAKAIFEEEGYGERLTELCVDFAGTYFNLNLLEESDMWLENATRLIRIHPDPYVEARLLYRRAILYTRKYIFEKSIDLLLEARKLLEQGDRVRELKEYHALAQVYSGLGFIYNKVDKLQESVEAYLQVIYICETFGFGMRLAWYYLHLGNSLSSVGKYKKAGKYFRKAITETPQDPSQYARAGASANLGQLYFLRGNYKSALAMYDYAEKLYSQKQGLDDDFNFSVLERYRAQLHAELDNEETALNHYMAALEYAEKSDDHKQISAIYRDLSEFYEEQEDYKQAYEFQLKYSDSREKYIDEEKTRAFTEMEVKYETEKRERETEFLRLQTTELQLKALRAQMNPHFIFNSLNSIQGYITGYNPDKAAIFFSKFSRLIRNSLEYSEFDVIPLEDEVQFLEDYLELEKERFKGDFDYSISISDEVEEDIMGIPPMIIQPYIENAIKHGVREVKNGFVSISFDLEDEDTYLCIVEDNGIGRELAALRQEEYQTKSHRSMGATITHQRLQLINRASGKELSTKIIDLFDDKGESRGTRVEIRIPIVDIDQRFYE